MMGEVLTLGGELQQYVMIGLGTGLGVGVLFYFLNYGISMAFEFFHKI